MWYDISCANRLMVWRQWRQTLDSMDYVSALSEVARIYMMVPRVNHYLAPDEQDRWPTPWELVNDNIYCDLAVGLGMFYSLQLSTHAQDHEFSMIILKHDAGWINLCAADGWLNVLNWQEGAIVNTPTLPSTANVIHQYYKIDLAAQLG